MSVNVRMGGVLVLVLATACGGAKKMAETAIASADSSIAALGPDAQNVIPDKFAELTSAVTSAKDAMAKNDFAGAAAAVKDVPAKAAELAKSVGTWKEELTKQWTAMSEAMPRNLDLVKTKIAELTKARKQPKGMPMDSVKAIQSEAEGAWPAVVSDWQSGKLADAMSKATAMRQRVSSAMEAVGLVSDDRAWGNLQQPKQ